MTLIQCEICGELVGKYTDENPCMRSYIEEVNEGENEKWKKIMY